MDIDLIFLERNVKQTYILSLTMDVIIIKLFIILGQFKDDHDVIIHRSQLNKLINKRRKEFKQVKII